MNLIDFALVEAANAGAAFLVWRFLLPKTASGSPVIPTSLSAFGQILSNGEQAVIKRLDAFEASLQLPTLETRIQNAMSQAGDELVAKIAALPAAIEAQANGQITSLQTELDAEKADHAADLANADAAVAAATPAVPGQQTAE